jgi:hypothetical protein
MFSSNEFVLRGGRDGQRLEIFLHFGGQTVVHLHRACPEGVAAGGWVFDHSEERVVCGDGLEHQTGWSEALS